MSLLDKALKFKPKEKAQEEPEQEVAEEPKIAIQKPKKQVQKNDSDATIIGLFGKQGSGKTFSACSFGKLGKVLYIDTENKAHIVKNSRFSDYDIDVVNVNQVDSRRRIDKLKTVQYFESQTPEFIKQLESGMYAVCVIDNCSIFRPFAKYEWLKRNPKRTKPQSYEWGEIEEIVQDLLYPFIDVCREKNIFLILSYGIKDLFLNDVVIGTTEDAKQWVLGVFDVEVWLEWDYKKYVIKHPYKPFWEYRDEEELMVDYILDNKFIDTEAVFKEYQQFKEETLISDVKKRELSRVREETRIQISSK